MDNQNHSNEESKCPFSGKMVSPSAGRGTRNRDWWPNQLPMGILRMHSKLSNPLEDGFNYAEAF
ncbi:MAG: hypothetical protein ACKO6I_08225, partial [Sphingomonadales bacterium]